MIWLSTALNDLRAFPPAARRRAGHELDLLQQGLEPTDWKPMPTVGDGVYELRIRAGGAFRVFYVMKRAEGVIVVHAFQKKSQQTGRSIWTSTRNATGSMSSTSGNATE